MIKNIDFELINKLIIKEYTTNISEIVENNQISSIKLPKEACDLCSYGCLLKYLINEMKVLPIGLFRNNNEHNENFFIINPSNKLILEVLFNFEKY